MPEAGYIYNIPGSSTLPQFQQMVEGVENAGMSFVKSSITFHENEITNLVTFRRLPNGQVPDKALTFLAGSPPASDGVKPEWQGVIVCSGSNVFVSALR